MKKRVFVIHGWDGYPEEGWFPWLKTELEKRGFSVTVPAMPHPEQPTIEDWVGALSQAVGTPDAQTYFVGHSIGCQTIMRYLAGLLAVRSMHPAKRSVIGGAVFVAGFFTLQNVEPNSVAIAKPWLETSIDTNKVRKVLAGKIAAIFSPTDRWVHIENKKMFEERLGATTYVVENKGERGHFSGSDGVTQLPLALELILKMTPMDNSTELSTGGIISFEEFSKVEIKMGTIMAAEKVEGSEKLIKLEIDFGSEKRTIVSGVAMVYSPEQMIGKQIPVIINLAPRKLKGIESQGMALYAIDGEKPIMLNPEKNVAPGSEIR